MAPILLNCAAAFASDVIDNISDRLAESSHKKAAATTETAFANALSQAQQTPAMKAAALADQQAALTGSLMSSPEVKAALATVKPTDSVQLEISASGGVSLRSASGNVQPLKLGENTRALVTHLYGMRQGAGVMPSQKSSSLVLAVDPAHTAAPVWSALPARI